MAQTAKSTGPVDERRRAAAERLRGLFADVAPGRSLSKELIAERRLEDRGEDREVVTSRRRGD